MYDIFPIRFYPLHNFLFWLSRSSFLQQFCGDGSTTLTYSLYQVFNQKYLFLVCFISNWQNNITTRKVEGGIRSVTEPPWLSQDAMPHNAFQQHKTQLYTTTVDQSHSTIAKRFFFFLPWQKNITSTVPLHTK